MSRLSRRELVQAGMAGALLSSVVGPVLAEAPERPDDSLERLAHAKGMHFGSALGTRAMADSRYLDLVRDQCGLIVPEGELKMPAIQPQPGEFHFERADALLAFAESNGLAVRGHCLLWHHPRWLPKWMETFDFGSNAAQGAEKFLTDHIARTTSRYGKRLLSWDVVNEAVDNLTGEMRVTPLSAAIGTPDRVLEIAFHAARDNLPDTELVYNDYMGWEPDDGPHRDGVLRLLERFRKNGVPVNSLGLQSHIGNGNQDSNASRAFDARDEKAWRKFLEEVTGMGYGLLVTEFDVHDATLPADFPTRDRMVATLGRAYLDLTLSFTQVNALLCWGLMDTHTWLQARTPRKDGLPKRPTPFDDQYRPKPLRDAIAAALLAAPPRRPTAIAGIPA